ncbi:phosphoenolpyruvate hydrolase family protein, partial [Burkholderia pseudomallei]
AKSVRDDVIVLCHGGPIASPEDAASILRACPQCHGFYGASSMERLPADTALTDMTRRFKEIERHAASGRPRATRALRPRNRTTM